LCPLPLQYVLYYPKAKKYVSLFAEDQKTAMAMNKKQKKILELAKEAKNISLAVSFYLASTLTFSSVAGR
jgi:hypothetical protein